MCAISSINSLDLLILRLLSVPERLDLLCRADREVALRAAARYIDLLLHHHECVHVCVYVPLSYCYRRVIDVQRVTCVTNDVCTTMVRTIRCIADAHAPPKTATKPRQGEVPETIDDVR